MQMQDESFDWVAERHACSLKETFARLVKAAKSDVEARKKQQDVKMQFDMSESEGELHIQRAPDLRSRLPRSVSFILTNECIHIAMPDNKEMRCVPYLTDDGLHRLKGDGFDLAEWQIRRKALEAILFD